MSSLILSFLRIICQGTGEWVEFIQSNVLVVMDEERNFNPLLGQNLTAHWALIAGLLR